MKIVFLIGSYVPHQLITIETLIAQYDAKIISFSVSENYKYIPDNSENLITHKLNDFSKEALLGKVLDFKPDIVIASGWMFSKYVWVCKELKGSLNIPIVSYSDTQWYGTFKQRINSLISPFYVKRAFTHMWVSGIYQYEYARKLGFEKEKIIFNALSCNIDLFKQVDLEIKKASYPKNFLFIGRFVTVKGLDVLVDAWNDIPDKNGWTLTLIGDGPLKKNYVKNKSLIVKDFMTQASIINEMEATGCLILPSIKEPWAVVIHEAAAAGLPIICTEACGAAPHFVINDYNGYKVKTGDVDDLKSALLRMVNASSEMLIEFSTNSRILANNITPSISVASLNQLIKK